VQGVLTQTAAGEPVEWQYPGRSPAPYAIVGQNTWRDYTVSARVILPAPGTALPAPGARAYTLNLTTRGTRISAQINGVLVAAVTNRLYRCGPAGLGSLGYYPVRYPSFTVR
jgi:hypothetical protein